MRLDANESGCRQNRRSQGTTRLSRLPFVPIKRTSSRPNYALSPFIALVNSPYQSARLSLMSGAFSYLSIVRPVLPLQDGTYSVFRPARSNRRDQLEYAVHRRSSR